MERNSGDMQESSGQNSSSSRPGFGDGGASNETDVGQNSRTQGGYADAPSGASGTQGGTDSLRDKASDLKSNASDKLSDLREKATDFKSTIADRLSSGAEKLRSRNDGSSGAYGSSNATGTFGNGGAGVDGSNRMAQVTDTLASGMDATAKFLREGDLKESIEQQAKSKPGRTLLIALGVGYLLGRAFRGSNES